jgi:hypothetical protein
MSQRLSGYKRKDGDCYETPAWVTQALLPHLVQARQVWEARADAGHRVVRRSEGGTVL